jgi:hypothetical protein
MENKITHCLNCKEEFSNKNVYSAAGWSETQISGFCEKCFDEITAEPPEDNYNDGDLENGPCCPNCGRLECRCSNSKN